MSNNKLILIPCICGTSISINDPYCIDNKGCLEYIIESESYLFDDSVSKSEKEKYILTIPIIIHKQLIKKDQIDIHSLEDSVKNTILEDELTPIDFLLPEILIDYPKNIIKLQKNIKMISFAKEIRKKNYTRNIIDLLDRLAEYWALFLYESRNHSIWNVIIDSLVKSSYTSEKLLRLLDNLYRSKSTEYLKFYKKLSLNQKLIRNIYIIDDSAQILVSNTDNDPIDNSEQLSVADLNFYANHWFPGIRLAVVKHKDIYKTNLERIYQNEFKWKENTLNFTQFDISQFIQNENENNPQLISPQLNEIIIGIINHNKVSIKILSSASKNSDKEVRKSVILSNNCNFKTIKSLSKDEDELIRKIANFKFLYYEQGNELKKEESDDEEKDKSKNKEVLISPSQLEYVIKNFSIKNKKD